MPHYRLTCSFPHSRPGGRECGYLATSPGGPRRAPRGTGWARFLAEQRSQRGDGTDYLAADDLERRHLPDPRHPADRDTEPHAGQRRELVGDLPGFLPLLADVEGVVARLDDLVVVPPLGLAVRAQHVELTGEVGAGEQVAGLGVAGHEPQRLPLARAADHDRRMRLGQGLRRVERPLQLVVLAVVGRLDCPQENHYHEQNVTHIQASLGNTREAY